MERNASGARVHYDNSNGVIIARNGATVEKLELSEGTGAFSQNWQGLNTVGGYVCEFLESERT